MSDINRDSVVQGLMDTWVDKNKPVSEQIRERVVKAGDRFFAADNISQYIEAGEREKLIIELTAKFESVLDSLVIDRVNDPNSSGTGRPCTSSPQMMERSSSNT